MHTLRHRSICTCMYAPMTYCMHIYTYLPVYTCIIYIMSQADTYNVHVHVCVCIVHACVCIVHACVCIVHVCMLL